MAYIEKIAIIGVSPLPNPIHEEGSGANNTRPLDELVNISLKNYRRTGNTPSPLSHVKTAPANSLMASTSFA